MLFCKAAGDNESFVDDFFESSGIDEIIDMLLVGEQVQGRFFRVPNDVESLPEGQVRLLHENGLRDIYDEPQAPYLFFLFHKLFLHK